MWTGGTASVGQSCPSRSQGSPVSWEPENVRQGWESNRGLPPPVILCLLKREQLHFSHLLCMLASSQKLPSSDLKSELLRHLWEWGRQPQACREVLLRGQATAEGACAARGPRCQRSSPRQPGPRPPTGPTPPACPRWRAQRLGLNAAWAQITQITGSQCRKEPGRPVLCV